MTLDERIEKLKQVINSQITPENAHSGKIVKLSQKLDTLIVEKTRRGLI